MQQRLCLAHALVHDPKVLLLDEPASGLDPRARVELRELLRELRNLGKTIVISSHILPELEELCTSVAIVDRGRVLAAGHDRGHRPATPDRRGAPRPRARRRGGVEAARAWFDGQPDVASADARRSRPDRDRLPRRRGRRRRAARRRGRPSITVASYSPAATDLQELFLQVTDRDDADDRRRQPHDRASRAASRSAAAAPAFRLPSGITAIIVKELRGRMRGRRAFIIVTLYVLLLAVFAWMSQRIHEEQIGDSASYGGQATYASATVGRGIFVGPADAPDADGRRARARGDGRRDQQRARAPDARAARGHADLVVRDRPRQAPQRARLGVRPRPRLDPGHRARVRLRRRRAGRRHPRLRGALRDRHRPRVGRHLLLGADPPDRRVDRA